jgi:predicted DNA-binding transcriptional regulator AlpA
MSLTSASSHKMRPIDTAKQLYEIVRIGDMLTQGGLKMDAADEWIAIPQAADLMHMTKPALAQLRYRGVGPRFYRLSRTTILYKRSEVLAWMESRACMRTDDLLAPS